MGTLADCIHSVASQSIDVEHILIDGGSKDGTLGIAEANSHHLALVVSEPDQGVYDAMNKGIRRATGEIIGILNADDVYDSDQTLSKVLDVFAREDVGACYGDLVYVDRHDLNKVTRYWKSGRFAPKKFHWGWMPPHPTFFVRREVYERYGLFRLDMGSAADYELMLRFLIKHRIAVGYVPEILVRMRAGGVSNVSIDNRLRANRMDRLAWSVNDLRPYPWTTILKPARKLGQWFSRPSLSGQSQIA
jgi:glycosyltransferase involved in cell wall biosynthesis